MIRSPETPSEKPRNPVPPGARLSRETPELEVRAPIPKEKEPSEAEMKAKVLQFMRKIDETGEYDCRFIKRPDGAKPAGKDAPDPAKEFKEHVEFIKGNPDDYKGDGSPQDKGNADVDISNTAYVALVFAKGNPDEVVGVAAFNKTGKMIGYAD